MLHAIVNLVENPAQHIDMWPLRLLSMHSGIVEHERLHRK